MGFHLKQFPYSTGIHPTLAHIETLLLRKCLPQSLVFLIIPENVSQVILINGSDQLSSKCHVEPATSTRHTYLPQGPCHHAPCSLGLLVAAETLSCAERFCLSHFCGVLCCCFCGPYKPSPTQCFPEFLINCPASSPFIGQI